MTLGFCSRWYKVQSLGFRSQGFVFRGQGCGSWVLDCGFKVQGHGFWDVCCRSQVMSRRSRIVNLSGHGALDVGRGSLAGFGFQAQGWGLRSWIIGSKSCVVGYRSFGIPFCYFKWMIDLILHIFKIYHITSCTGRYYDAYT